ncbi:hypothetical protein SCP_0400160 [Sparassis crispa]|uniref:Uncharacterized protein n=1 Tax=Sparassis crispa TaxID=139825 RepID=A0A401GHQ5_9APHY|nr:hypothetical protein SCP_0400160 [Sparassis crispa]GBE81645.1 hypothetical protein SCP_0400160 [Sparassis crispa]
MSTLATLYNNLPTLGEADDKFVDRANIFAKVGPLLAKYDNKFGLYLVHAHCSLEDGEKMVASGNVSEPVKDASCYPERWLATGEAYEFNTEHTEVPPAALFVEFRSLVGDMTAVLGLYYAGNVTPGMMLLEHTEGRKNIVEAIDVGIGNTKDAVPTAWLPDAKDPVTMACVIECDTRITRTGSAHKDTRSHRPL